MLVPARFLETADQAVAKVQFGSKDAVKPEDAASSSFDCFNIDQKERDAMTRSAAVTTGEHTLYAALSQPSSADDRYLVVTGAWIAPD